MTFFIVHHGGRLAVEFIVQRPSPELLNNAGIRIPHAVFWQFYDANEKLVAQTYHKFAADSETGKTFRIELADASPGVYQLRYAKSPSNKMTVDLRTDPAASFGVMPCRARLGMGAKGQFANAYLYVPPGHSSVTLHTYATQLELLDLAGRVVGKTGKKAVTLRVKADRLYRVKAAARFATSAFGISGVPPILAPDEPTARNIRGSIEIAPDGRILHHKFQLRMWRWMHSLKPDELDVAPKPLLPLKELWIADPRNAGLVGIDAPFNHVPRILRDQDLDPKSKTYGLGTNACWLGPAFVIDKPFNPYRRDPAILKRILLYEFAKFLSLNENGTFNPNDWDQYAGGDGLGYGQRAFQFGYVAPLVEGPLRGLWFEAASKVLNRWAFSRVTCENQTSSWMRDLYSLYLGSGREVYKTLAHDFALAFYDPALNTFMKTGYQQERYGPDATYNGLCASNQALYYKFSRDEIAKKGLRKTYDLFNHTVAPEPDGRLFGASSFSHRTTGSWVQRQWNAGFSLMADEVPEAGMWYPDMADLAKYRANERKRIEKMLGVQWDDAWYEQNMRWLSTYAYHPWTSFFHRYMFPFRGLAKGQWPGFRAQRFDTNANNEFLFIRRPRYYAMVYTGRTMNAWVKAGRKPVPYRAGWKMVKGTLQPTTADSKKAGWWPTQGLAMFWTPGYGNAVLGKNWNVYTAQMLRADRGDGKVSWQDYWGFSHEYDAAANTLILKNPMVDLPMAVTRRVTFLEAGLRQDVRAEATGDVDVERLVEQIPYLKKEGSVILFKCGDKWGSEPESLCSAVWLGNANGEGVAITFASPVRLRKGVASRSHRHTIGLIEVELGSRFRAGAAAQLSYTLAATRRESL